MAFFTSQWLLLLFVITFTTTTMSAPNMAPRLSPFNRFLKDPASMNVSKQNVLSGDYQTFFYRQTLDHFNYKPESYGIFQQRYIINSRWWGGADRNSPIFVYLGAEAPIDEDLMNIGFLFENAEKFSACLVYLEHRFYGESNPVEQVDDPNSVTAMEESVRDANTRGYFNSAQALADYAELLLYIKHEQLKAHNSPIIVIGGSYGGMLAAWFRLKYPHIAMSALASSAPLLYFDNITPQDGYYSTITKDFRDVSENCYTTIKQSWNVIDDLASQPSGLDYLSQKFRTCSPLSNSYELKNYLKAIYMVSAQYDVPPTYPVTLICQAIDAASGDSDILDRILAGLAVYQPGASCYNMAPGGAPSQSAIGWQWQVCSELVIPMGVTSPTSMFQGAPFDPNEYNNNCLNSYGVMPRPHWTTTYYGGQDIRSVLKNFGSNIIFSNGLRDPYSSGGVLEKISDSILAINTDKGAHCMDIHISMPTDPEWLVQQRKNEVKIIDQWFQEYYQNLS